MPFAKGPLGNTALLLGAALAIGVASAGCVEINGGAVEVSWAIFARDGRAITDCTCADPNIVYVRLNLVSDPDGTLQPCAGVNSCRFTCGRNVGATPFMVPPGQYLMSLVPVGADGSDLPIGPLAPSVEIPAPESRAVVRGQPTELEAFMLEANCATSCDKGSLNPCTGG